MTSAPARPNCTNPSEPDALPVAAALDRILTAIRPVDGTEIIPLALALHRTLAEPVISPRDIPPHTNAAVDGYAVRARDLPQAGQQTAFEVSGRVLAGQTPSKALGPHQAVHIMTGAPLPPEADTVLMQEQVEVQGTRIVVGGRHRRGENVRPAGEDIRCGETILNPGRLLLPPDLGLIASLGRIEVRVRRRPRAALLSTGDEILPPGTPHQPGKLYDSNRFSLMGALSKLPLEMHDYGIVPDTETRLREVLREAAARCDVLISSGGVSVGAADHTRKVLGELGETAFRKVAIKPGRPLAFGRLGEAVFFGLPGNPVAVLVTFYQFVLPALFRLAGVTAPPLVPTFPARAGGPMRKKPGRTEFQRGILSRTGDGQWQVGTTGRQGSGVLSSMSLANCFIVLEHDCGPVEAGEWVEVLPFAGLLY